MDSFKANTVVKFSLWLILLLIPLLTVFLWQEDLFDITRDINHEKFGTFGDFFGGVVGSIWALCGVILFYIALNEQRKDFKNNKDALIKQVESLNLQTEQFKLQKDELVESRKVFLEQSKTLKQQRFESTFFSLINLYNQKILNLNGIESSNNFFKNKKDELVTLYEKEPFKETNHRTALNSYIKLFYENKEELTHYYKTIYRIIKIVDDSELIDNEKSTYVKILRSQLSENELLLIYYNAETKYGEKFYPLILKYNLLKHLPSLSKLEFNEFKLAIDSAKSDLHHFNSFIFDLLDGFLTNLEQKEREEMFSEERISVELHDNESVIVEFLSSQINELNVRFVFPLEIEKIYCFSSEEFSCYFKYILDDFLIYSRYNSVKEFEIEKDSTVELNNNILKFKVTSNRKIQLNVDKRGNN